MTLLATTRLCLFELASLDLGLDFGLSAETLLELVLGLLDRGWVLGYGFVPEAQGLGLGDLGLGEAWRRGRWGGDLPSVSPVLFIGLDVEIMVAWSS